MQIAFERLVTRWALRTVGVEEWLMTVVMAMYCTDSG